jgi:hypothetical protein
VDKTSAGGRRVSINVNNDQGKYFRTFKGLRQGAPLSPLLFNLVVDALSALLEAPSRNGRISWLVPHMVDDGLTHLQYADDTVVMIQMDEESLVNLKLVLYCFESMSGMKINYHKSELFVVGWDLEMQREIAGKFNCKLDSFPMCYLGIPLHTRRLKKHDMQMVNEKMRKRNDPWQGRLMSSGGG